MKSIHFETIDSTNTYLKENYKNLDNFTFVDASFQTNGRGRNNRSWKSEKGENLLFSLLIKDESLIKEFKSLSIVSALSIIHVLNINNLSIKWPNDIYHKDNKLAGILLEAISTNKIECLIIGIGINVNQKEFLGDYKKEPTSLCKILNEEVDKEAYAEIDNKTKSIRVLGINKDYSLKVKDDKKILNLNSGEITFHI